MTGAGGLALLAAAVMLWAGGRQRQPVQPGGWRIEPLTEHPTLCRRSLALILLAAFTKSAQFPFHFWLPNAMQAPTPVSAYLHSATMVKAGVYLVARMTPLLGGIAALDRSRSRSSAALTMLGASYRAVHRNGSQAHPRVLHDQRARRADAAARHRHAARRSSPASRICWRTRATRVRSFSSPVRSSTRRARAT